MKAEQGMYSTLLSSFEATPELSLLRPVMQIRWVLENSMLGAYSFLRPVSAILQLPQRFNILQHPLLQPIPQDPTAWLTRPLHLNNPLIRNHKITRRILLLSPQLLIQNLALMHHRHRLRALPNHTDLIQHRPLQIEKPMAFSES